MNAPWQIAKDCGDFDYPTLYDAGGHKLAWIFEAEVQAVIKAAPLMLKTLEHINAAFNGGVDVKSRYSHEVRAALRAAGVTP